MQICCKQETKICESDEHFLCFQFGIGDLIASKNVSKIVGDIDDEAR